MNNFWKWLFCDAILQFYSYFYLQNPKLCKNCKSHQIPHAGPVLVEWVLSRFIFKRPADPGLGEATGQRWREWGGWVGPAAAAAAAVAAAAAAWNYSGEEIYAAASLCWRCERASWAEADQMWSGARSGRGQRGGSGVCVCWGVAGGGGGGSARSRSHKLISSRVAVAARSKNTAVPSWSRAAANSRGGGHATAALCLSL